MKSLSVFSAFAAVHLFPASAESVLLEQVWGSVIYTLYGDRTPYIYSEYPTLTPFGSQQLFSVGTSFRDRYLTVSADASGGSTGITGISKYFVDNNQIEILATSDEFVIASAQAFMQGLYPPLQDSVNATLTNDLSQMADGYPVIAPLNGYQYPEIYTASALDFNSIWIAGHESCTMYTASAGQYFSSDEFKIFEDASQGFYASLEPILKGAFSNSTDNFYEAYYIWDYINYEHTHNATIADQLTSVQLAQARLLSDDWVFALNANLTASGLTHGDHIRAIAGRTLATRIVNSLYANLNSQGESNKMTLMFGSFEPIVAFAALAQLPSEERPQFYSTPDLGASMVFELFSLSAEELTDYPEETDLFVRFLYQNGTGAYSQLIEYPLFNNDPSVTYLSFESFVAALQNFMILGIGEWCTTCNSYSIFCPAFVGTPTEGSSDSNSNGSRLNPVLAGVIGAVVTVVALGLITAVAMLFGGIRFYRSSSKRRSELGGFKGGEKLASDQDLTIAKTRVGATVSDADASNPRGHERVGSWELAESMRAKDAQLPNIPHPAVHNRRPSFEDDDLHVTPFGSPVKADDRV